MNNKYLIVDFDSTFIQVEALDELAAIALADHPESESVVEKIKTITAQGMEGKISLSESLASRIKLLSANKNHIAQLVEILKDKVSPSFKRNVAFLNQFSSVFTPNNLGLIAAALDEAIFHVERNASVKIMYLNLSMYIGKQLQVVALKK